MSTEKQDLTAVEGIKTDSGYLRGTLEQSLADTATGALAEDDTQLSKFHGFYQQDDRDVREERRKAFLEPDYQFMIRARVPGGVCTPDQWLALDAIARRWANGTLRLTTRQAFQFHGVVKSRLKPTIRAINDALLDTLAACGDVNRNVMATALPESSEIHRQVFDLAREVSAHLTPNTSAYHEIWLKDSDGRRNVATSPADGDAALADHEPIYGPTYLPRKFKMGFAIPPRNDTDLYSQDLGFIAIADGEELEGFNVIVGGGMGSTHGDPGTYPLLAQGIGFCTPEQVIEVSEAVVRVQRDHGNRSNRKRARLKYTIEDHGLDWFRQQLARRLGYELEPSRSFAFTHNGDLYGWRQSSDGLWHLGLNIENGRLANRGVERHLDGMRELARIHRGEFRLTANQNVIVSGVRDADRVAIDRIVRSHRLDGYQQHSPLRLHAMACVGLPTCALSMAESERYLPSLTDKLDGLLARHGLQDQAITLRMTGCPNGCARPYLAEIGLVGKGPGLYNLHLGAAFDGSRLNTLYRESVTEEDILEQLDVLFGRFARERQADEHFGDYLLRSGVVTMEKAA